MIYMKNHLRRQLDNYRFIDLFGGIGGFHLALSSFGAQCVFASDIDAEARKVYAKNFNIEPKGNIKTINSQDIPSHDILCGGFPCQSFSVSGTQAGFGDEKTGKLFFEIVRIAKYHQPKIILLENVANLESHDKGKSLKRIADELREIEYQPFSRVLNSIHFNVPQSRKRLYIVAFNNDLNIKEFKFPQPTKTIKRLKDILLDDTDVPNEYYVDREFSLRDEYQKIEFKKERPYIRIGEIGSGRQGERIYSIDGCATTLSASGGGLGGRTGLYLKNERIRKLTPRECARLMGFPNKFIIAETANQAYQQFGNSVVVDVLQRILIEAINTLGGE